MLVAVGLKRVLISSRFESDTNPKRERGFLRFCLAGASGWYEVNTLQALRFKRLYLVTPRSNVPEKEPWKSPKHSVLMLRRADGHDAGRSSANDRLGADRQIAKSHDPDRAVAGVGEACDSAFGTEAHRVMAPGTAELLPGLASAADEESKDG